MTTAQYLQMLPIMTQDGPLSVYEMRRFCGSSHGRQALMTPWTCHGRMFATDGRCLVTTRSEEAPADSLLPSAYGNMTAQILAWPVWNEKPSARVRIAGPTPTPYSVCTECGGNGVSMARGCGDCDGCGLVWNFETAAELAPGFPFVGLKYLHILHTAFPNAVWEAHGASEAFKHGGWLIRDARAMAVLQPALLRNGRKTVVATEVIS